MKNFTKKLINPTLHRNGSASQSCIVKVLNTPQFTVIEWMILSICQYLFIYLFTALTVKWHFNLPLILCKSHFFGGSFLHHYEIHTLNHFGYFGFVRRKRCNRIWNTHLLRPPDNVVFYVFTWLSLVFDASNLTLSFGFVWTKSRILSFFCQKNLTSSFVSFAITINKWFFSELIKKVDFFPIRTVSHKF